VSQPPITTARDLSGRDLRSLRVTPYDRVASLIVALVILIGSAVAIMTLLLLTMRIVRAQHAVPLELMEELEPAAASLSTGGGEDFEEPGVEELQETVEPQLSDMLEAVTTAVTNRPAALEELVGDAVQPGRGSGDGRLAGPGGEGGADVIPFGRRTKIHYGEISQRAYGALLDYFGIELAAAGGGQPDVDYASGFSQGTPQHRSGSPDAEKRVYLIWRRGSRLESFDRNLLALAGVDVSDRQVMQFLPPPVEKILRTLEKQYAGDRDETQLRMTVYGIRKQDNQYQFYVLEQQYRVPRS
jgi:hypothetical protein